MSEEKREKGRAQIASLCSDTQEPVIALELASRQFLDVMANWAELVVDSWQELAADVLEDE